LQTVKLFYAPPSCSLVAMAALEVANAAYEPVLVDLGGDRAQLRRVNPLGKVPTLDADGEVITDTVAILYWLAQRYPAARLLPTDDVSAMSAALARMAWFGNVLHIVRRRYILPIMFSGDADAQASIREKAAGEYRAGLAQVNSWIGDLDCPLGVRLYALLFFHWATRDQIDLSMLDDLRNAVEPLIAREEVRRALDLHQSPLLD
jgi:glutathione S-transferase